MTTAAAVYSEHRLADPEALAAALATALAERLAAGLAARGRAALVVSGGRTPARTFARLARQPLDWPRITVTLADERWVAVDDPASNEALVRAALLADTGATFVGLYTGHARPEAAEAAVAARLAAVPRPFDAVLLGLGDDGHTASLFPGAAGLAEALEMTGGRLCKTIRAPGAPEPRMTLTLPALLAARRIYLLFEGADKRRAFEAALAPGPIEAMPVRAVLRQDRVPVDVYWCPATGGEGAVP